MSHRLCILGSTGSIGESTLDVVARHPDRFRITALTARHDDRTMLAQILRHRPETVVMAEPAAAGRLREALRGAVDAADLEQGEIPRVLEGARALEQVVTAEVCDTVMAAIVGAAGLPACLAAARAGRRILLANKEALVVGGEHFMQTVAAGGAELLPIDSEHNAIFQCLPAPVRIGEMPRGVRRLLLTASGGPFLRRDPSELGRVTPDEACRHPNWSMGRKISVDSATLMNKGLELIEASRLFGMPSDRIEVVVHPQSVVHSLVEYADGSVLAQMGYPDMRTPIAHALAHPERMEAGVGSLSLAEMARLDFEAPDPARFPALGLCREAARVGGGAPVILNAANEVAVQAFLDARVGFTAIAGIIEETMDGVAADGTPDLESILHLDGRARAAADEAVARRSSP